MFSNVHDTYYTYIASACLKQFSRYAINKVWDKFLAHTTTWLDLEDIILGKISQTQKAKYSMILLT